MQPKEPTKYQIGDHPGEWVIKDSWISDLGLIMIRFYDPERKIFMNINTRTTVEQAFGLPWASKSEDNG